MKNRTCGRIIKKATMRRRTAKKSRSMSRKAGSMIVNKYNKPTKARKSSKSRSRSSIRCVQKKRVASKRRSVNRNPKKQENPQNLEADHLLDVYRRREWRLKDVQ